jgi:hypothetical protein
MAGAGLSTRDVETVRAALAAGRRPKVVFTPAAGQIAGQTGQIIQLTDPKAGEDFVVVRFGRDELPFTPAEVTIPPRAPATPRKPKAPRGSSTAAPENTAEPAAENTAEPAAVGAEEAAAPEATAAAKAPSQRTAADAPDARMPSGAAPAGGSATSAGATTSGGTKAGATRADGTAVTKRQEKQSVDSDEQTPAAPARRTPRQAKPKPPAALTVTLSYAEGEWTVGATQGTRALAKPYVIKPAEALKFVGLLDVPGVHEAVEQIIAAERDTARGQAERLRAELAEIEAKLAELGA